MWFIVPPSPDDGGGGEGGENPGNRETPTSRLHDENPGNREETGVISGKSFTMQSERRRRGPNQKQPRLRTANVIISYAAAVLLLCAATTLSGKEE